MELKKCLVRMVESQMTDWAKNIQEKTHPDEIDEIVRCSGFANRMEWKDNGRADRMWCGMFAAAHAFKAGFAKALRPGLWHVKNVVDFFNYNYGKRVPKFAVLEDGTRVVLREFHDLHDAPRMWISHEDLEAMVEEDGPQMVGFADVGLVCQGCILLEDREGDGTPNHITTVKGYSYDGVITTVEGNASGIMASGKKAKRDAVTLKYRDLGDPKQRKKIHGVGLFSLMDFVHRSYERG